jgi:hypothetical protein
VRGIVDFHVHTAPSIVPRHHDDHEIGPLLEEVGIETYVLKAHEGSTAERATLAGHHAVGAIVLNSPVGGPNPDAVEVAFRLGARVVWMPTISSETHKRNHQAAQLAAHQGIAFNSVPVCRDGRVLPEWHDVLDAVAAHDLILAAGHLSIDETVEVFRVARLRGVQRFLVNHPLLEFLGWRDEHVDSLKRLGAYVEVGVLADLLDGGDETATVRLAGAYPRSLLVFGSDLGHAHYPDVRPGVDSWLERTEVALGSNTVEVITTRNGNDLLSR